ncbi:MAG: GNAT family N-acetyltransferase [Terriglobia bacterium]
MAEGFDARPEQHLGMGFVSIFDQINRLIEYHRRHGIRVTVQRAGLAARRALFSGRSVLFYCDLSRLTAPPVDVPSFLKVERKRGEAELSPQDLKEMTSFWNPKLARRNIKERFGKGASLWLIKSHDKLAGYGWTLRGSTVESHYFPLGVDDVHLFDFFVVRQYRGKGINPAFVSYILSKLSGECAGRAFIEAAEWNRSQLASLQKTAFRRLVSARKMTILSHTIVFWSEKPGVSPSKPMPRALVSHNRRPGEAASIASRVGIGD